MDGELRKVIEMEAGHMQGGNSHITLKYSCTNDNVY